MVKIENFKKKERSHWEESALGEGVNQQNNVQVHQTVCLVQHQTDGN